MSDREQFEAWAASKNWNVTRCKYDSNGYESYSTGLLWLGWQAARRAEPKCVSRMDVLSLSEAARCLGVAQAKGDTDAIEHWKAESLRLESAICAKAEPERNASHIDLAHELWAMAQLMPGEGIEDAVTRIADRLSAEPEKVEPTLQDFADAVKQLCKDFSDLRDRPYMGDVYTAIDGLLEQFTAPQQEQNNE